LTFRSPLFAFHPLQELTHLIVRFSSSRSSDLRTPSQVPKTVVVSVGGAWFLSSGTSRLALPHLPALFAAYRAQLLRAFSLAVAAPLSPQLDQSP